MDYYNYDEVSDDKVPYDEVSDDKVPYDEVSDDGVYDDEFFDNKVYSNVKMYSIEQCEEMIDQLGQQLIKLNMLNPIVSADVINSVQSSIKYYQKQLKAIQYFCDEKKKFECEKKKLMRKLNEINYLIDERSNDIDNLNYCVEKKKLETTTLIEKVQELFNPDKIEHNYSHSWSRGRSCDLLRTRNVSSRSNSPSSHSRTNNSFHNHFHDTSPIGSRRDSPIGSRCNSHRDSHNFLSVLSIREKNLPLSSESISALPPPPPLSPPPPPILLEREMYASAQLFGAQSVYMPKEKPRVQNSIIINSSNYDEIIAIILGKFEQLKCFKQLVLDHVKNRPTNELFIEVIKFSRQLLLDFEEKQKQILDIHNEYQTNIYMIKETHEIEKLNKQIVDELERRNDNIYYELQLLIPEIEKVLNEVDCCIQQLNEIM